MSEYTGPITVIEFNGPKDDFFLTIHVNADDPESIEKITKRLAEDGYKPNEKTIRKWYMVNGSIDGPRENPMPRLSFRRASAFLRV